MLETIAGRRAAVTGAASGIGEAVARRLVEDGVEVLAVDRVEPQVGGATPLVADLATGEGRAAVVEAADGFDYLVNAVAPGYTRTELLQQALDDGSQQEEWMLQSVPLDRLADPDEIARAVCYLASDDASYVTGQTLLVDGGWTIQGTASTPDWLRA